MQCFFLLCALLPLVGVVDAQSATQTLKVAIRGDNHAIFNLAQSILDRVERDLQLKTERVANPPGTWSDLLNDTQSGKYDLTAATFSVTADRAEKVLFTASIVQGEWVAAVRTKEAMDPGLVFHPFSWNLWLASCAVFLIIAACEYFAAPNVNLSDAVWFSAMLPFTPPNPQPKGSFLRMAVFGWKCVWLMLLAAYASNLTAKLTVLVRRPEISTIEEVAKSGVLVGVPGGTYAEDWAEKQGLKNVQLLETDDPQVGITMLMEGKVDAYINDLHVIATVLTDSAKACGVYTLRKDVGRPWAFALPTKNEELRDRISLVIFAMRDDGTLENLHRQWLPAPLCKSAKSTSLSFGAISSVLVLFACSLPLAVLHGLTKHFFVRRAERKRAEKAAKEKEKAIANGEIPVETRDPRDVLYEDILAQVRALKQHIANEEDGNPMQQQDAQQGVNAYTPQVQNPLYHAPPSYQ